MTKMEIAARINQLKDNIFYLNMKDRWTFKDRLDLQKWQGELYALKQQLNKVG